MIPPQFFYFVSQIPARTNSDAITNGGLKIFSPNAKPEKTTADKGSKNFNTDIFEMLLSSKAFPHITYADAEATEVYTIRNTAKTFI